jgi:hypothetical protein
MPETGQRKACFLFFLLKNVPALQYLTVFILLPPLPKDREVTIPKKTQG